MRLCLDGSWFRLSAVTVLSGLSGLATAGCSAAAASADEPAATVWGTGANGSGPGNADASTNGGASIGSGAEDGDGGAAGNGSGGACTNGTCGPRSNADAAPACDPSKCPSGVCDYAGRCATAPSCAQHHGGDTCGAGTDGDANAKFESCCTSLPLPNHVGGETTAPPSIELDKFVITAGRMRSFVAAVGGNVRAFTQAIPATNSWWNHDWDAYVPSTSNEVDLQLGPYPAPLSPDPIHPDPTNDSASTDFNAFGQWRHGCAVGEGGARTWWSPGTLATDIAPLNYSQDVLDEKPIDCVDAYFLTAMCIYDGGHLATADDLAAAWGEGPYPWSDVRGDADGPMDLMGSPLQTVGTTSYPTCQTDFFPATTNANPSCYNAHANYPFVQNGNTYTPTFDVTPFQDKVVREFGGQFIGPFTYTWPMDLGATGMTDNSTHMAAPGRMPAGASKSGHMDLAGLEFELTAIQPTRASIRPTSLSMPNESTGAFQSGSWETHAMGYGSGKSVEATGTNGAWWAYWAAGGRCAHGGTNPSGVSASATGTTK